MRELLTALEESNRGRKYPGPTITRGFSDHQAKTMGKQIDRAMQALAYEQPREEVIKMLVGPGVNRSVAELLVDLATYQLNHG